MSTHETAQGSVTFGSAAGVDAVSGPIAPIGSGGPQEPAIPLVEREGLRKPGGWIGGFLRRDPRSPHAEPHIERVVRSDFECVLLLQDERRGTKYRDADRPEPLTKEERRRAIRFERANEQDMARHNRAVERERAKRRRRYETRWHTIYKMYDKRDRLLYVGIAVDGPKRVESHERNKQWFRKVARIELEHVKGREAALARELDLIRSADPIWNVVGKERT